MSDVLTQPRSQMPREQALVLERLSGCLLWVVGHKLAEQARINETTFADVPRVDITFTFARDMTSQNPMVPKTLLGRDKDTAWIGFLILAGLFIANPLPATSFSASSSLGMLEDQQSVGLLPIQSPSS